MEFRITLVITVNRISPLMVYYLSILNCLGLELARLADLPEDVLTEAQRVATRLTELEESRKQSSESIRIATHRKALLRVSHRGIRGQMSYEQTANSRIF